MLFPNKLKAQINVGNENTFVPIISTYVWVRGFPDLHVVSINNITPSSQYTFVIGEPFKNILVESSTVFVIMMIKKKYQ